ncbi:hypothetical protein FJT64_024370 [Amphibalanus amphitrite]|uniref:G-protein coupled receptors family 1 profile domain-containing protein n=1 Tax=Amphibalanus amphitrite TaxID=1232801 RepID=A0A6A4WCJ7_AMPAM|nr:hypothetical protein FJT64_024370 [Amphibalanus amphitrite]
MALCLLDCFLGCSIGAMVVTIVIYQGISDAPCLVFEALVNGTMHTISALMLALSRDRFRSVRDPIGYRAAVRRSVVWRHLALAVLYGLTLGGGAFVASRRYLGSGLQLYTPLCDTFDWLLDPLNRPVALVSVSGNIVVDFGTIVYNARIMHCAWKAKNEIVGMAGAQRNLTEEAQRRRNMKIVVFTFKLACLFVGCSLPYKVAILLYGLGLSVPRLVFDLLGLIRILYHVVDGWIVCTNSELLEAMKLMLCPCGNGE